MDPLLLLLSILTGCAPAPPPAPSGAPSGRTGNPRVLLSTYVTRPPAIDADLSDWDTTSFVLVTPANGVFDLELGPDAHTDDPGNLSFRFGVANDDEYLYVACIVTDDAIVLDTNPDPAVKHCQAWKDDTVEIFIDGNHNRSPDRGGVELETGGEFSTVANGAVTSWSSGAPGTEGDPMYWESAASYPPPPAPAYQAPWDRQAGGYRVEARFHYRLMGPGVGPGSTIGFTISPQDDDDGGDEEYSFYWQGVTPRTHWIESGWGDVVLARRPAGE